MNLKDQINEGIKEAMKAKQSDRLRALRGIKSAFMLQDTAEGGAEVSEADRMKALQKLAKQRKDSLDIYEQQGREDLAKVEREELAVIEEFLPAQMGEAEVRAAVQAIITESGASGMKDMSKVMPVAMSQLGGQADGKLISALVKELLG
ncbi:MAG: GatB/YqeY domain-containing protein [Bacteroidetes bacterium]|nr:GatB/YqeY domain-containing protein [Bacteroidota bacterium]MDA1112612.1 GatB/YqeY domain-containing protein [Bacteroidota bacterium]